jgi:hypothetical protein
MSIAPLAPQSLADLVALAAIRQLKAAYCRFVDTKQWDQLRALFTADATIEGSSLVADGSSVAEFIDGSSERFVDVVSIHHVHEPEIVLTGPEMARGCWPLSDYVEFLNGDPIVGRGWIGWGRYEEEYRRIDGQWRIAFMRIARYRVDEITADHPAFKPGRIPPSPDWL